jgi:hypothetical protein
MKTRFCRYVHSFSTSFILALSSFTSALRISATLWDDVDVNSADVGEECEESHFLWLFEQILERTTCRGLQEMQDTRPKTYDDEGDGGGSKGVEDREDEALFSRD